MIQELQPEDEGGRKWKGRWQGRKEAGVIIHTMATKDFLLAGGFVSPRLASSQGLLRLLFASLVVSLKHEFSIHQFFILATYVPHCILGPSVEYYSVVCDSVCDSLCVSVCVWG